MSDRVRSHQGGRSTVERPLTKAEKRAAAKAARAAAVTARRRRQVFTGVLASLTVVAVVAVAFVLFTRGGDDGGSTASRTGASGTAATPGFPPLPAGADPALANRPTARGGDGELKKLTVTPLLEGKGTAAQAGQRITVNYVGVSYRTGEEFDASWDRARPYSFQLGAGNVIPGWDQGLIGVRVGSRVQLDIPADLAYGETSTGGRPAGPLRFIVDLLAVG